MTGALTLSNIRLFPSHYLNAITDSEIRATVLSFKGIVFNLGYGMAGVLLVLSRLFAFFLGSSSSSWSFFCRCAGAGHRRKRQPLENE